MPIQKKAVKIQKQIASKQIPPFFFFGCVNCLFIKYPFFLQHLTKKERKKKEKRKKMEYVMLICFFFLLATTFGMITWLA